MSQTETSEQDAELATPLAETVRPVPRLQYLHSYTYVFEGGDAFLNLALVSVCMLIPIIGPIVLAGYQYDIVVALHRDKNRTYPEFDFGRFGEYLSRGIWKFLADMITQMFVMPVYFAAYFISFFVIFAVGAAFAGPQGNNAGPAIGIAAMIVVPLGLLAVLAVTIAMRLVLNPLVLKASLSGEGADLFDFRFMIDYVRKTWKETLLELLWIYVTFPIMVVLGLLLCLIGVYPAVAWAMLADAHTNWQIYEIYLARGGEPIRLKMDKPGPVVAAPVN